MTTALWWSTGLGAGLGALYGLASFLTSRHAARRGPAGFMVLYLGGMVARMAGALALIVLAFVFLPLRKEAFVGAFLLFFVIGLAADLLHLLARRRRS